LYSSGDAEMRNELRRTHSTYLRRQLREGVAAGIFGAEISVDLVTHQLLGLNSFFVQEWVISSMSLERACLEAEFGFSVVLLGLATEAGRKRLLARNAELEARIEGTT
jgi:hypothetical protein